MRIDIVETNNKIRRRFKLAVIVEYTRLDSVKEAVNCISKSLIGSNELEKCANESFVEVDEFDLYPIVMFPDVFAQLLNNLSTIVA